MNARRMIFIAAVGLIPALHATEAPVEQGLGPSLEAVESIPALTRLHGWKVVDDDSLIVWATAAKPYLLELDRPSHDLKFAETIGVTEFAGQIHSRFDSVWIRGLPYRIDRIYKLSREDAKAL